MVSALATILSHPDEIPSLLRVRYQAYLCEKLPRDPHLAFCYRTLTLVSRSFAIVIQQLGSELRDAVCIFYLVLRSLDTIEDDTSIDKNLKLQLLKDFHKYIYDTEWKFVCGTGHYKNLMQNHHHVSTVFLSLEKKLQNVIADITRRMGEGMAKFIEKEVESVADFDEYCHYVAGLVGIGLSSLFYELNLEKKMEDQLSNSMGLFLQKTNIIRDYLEDINELPYPRMFWANDIWKKYAEKLSDFRDWNSDSNSDSQLALKSVYCLNELINNALEHAEDSLVYMEALKDKKVFRFCAIPQIMAIGTLSLCYNNYKVYKSVVKMRKGLSAKIMDKTTNMCDVYNYYYFFANEIQSKINLNDPNSKNTLNTVLRLKKKCRDSLVSHHSENSSNYALNIAICILLFVLIFFAFFKQAY